MAFVPLKYPIRSQEGTWPECLCIVCHLQCYMISGRALPQEEASSSGKTCLYCACKTHARTDCHRLPFHSPCLPLPKKRNNCVDSSYTKKKTLKESYWMSHSNVVIKRRMQQFGDISGSQAWFSYCKQGICYQILSTIYFHLLKYSLFQWFCSPKNWVLWFQRCYFLSSLTHLCEKLVSCSYIISTTNVFSVLQKQRNWPCSYNTFEGDCIYDITMRSRFGWRQGALQIAFF